MFWEEMGKGRTIWNALYETELSGGLGMREALWGANGTIDIGVINGDDNLFLYGNGIFTSMKLDP